MSNGEKLRAAIYVRVTEDNEDMLDGIVGHLKGIAKDQGHRVVRTITEVGEWDEPYRDGLEEILGCAYEKMFDVICILTPSAISYDVMELLNFKENMDNLGIALIVSGFPISNMGLGIAHSNLIYNIIITMTEYHHTNPYNLIGEPFHKGAEKTEPQRRKGRFWVLLASDVMKGQK